MTDFYGISASWMRYEIKQIQMVAILKPCVDWSVGNITKQPA
jgi:hypothetical protein